MANRNYYDVIIAGAGPSGMTAALSCARRGLTVLLADRNSQVGRKLLVTGNGRCNLTNTLQEPACYRSDNPDLAWARVRTFPAGDTMGFLKDLGIYLTDRDGYVYPYSGQAATVREAFERALDREPGIRVLTETRLVDMKAVHSEPVKKYPDRKTGPDRPVRFQLILEEDHEPAGKAGKRKKEEPRKKKERQSYYCGCLLLATGGLAGEKFGCQGDGYRFAVATGHKLVRRLPALTALKTSAPFVKRISGVRCPAQIEALTEGVLLARETGELQWTDYGISGVAVFQLSRHVILALEDQKKVEVRINFLPGMDRPDLMDLLYRLGGAFGKECLQDVFSGIFPSKLAQVLVRETRCDGNMAIDDLAAGDWDRICRAVLAFPLKISGYMGFEKAQTTRGGVLLTDLTDRLESRKTEGLFFAGELVDVDGTCGGYNLQWAFSSGHLAARGIINKMLP